jgi:SAM-dependent methyltransferase
MARADFNRVAHVYDAGRGLAEDAMDAWRTAAVPHLTGALSPGLDLGCGTGRFTAALVEWTGCDMVGVDPAGAMLAQAARRPCVEYLLGRAENIPLREASCGFAWLSTVIHHIELPRAAREVRRVVRPSGAVFIRSWFPGRADVTHFRYFPRAKEIAGTFPTVDAVVDVFEQHGFEQTSLESVAQVSAPSLRDFRERVKTRADTTLLALTDAEFEEGMRALDADAAAETEPRPVISYLDLLVLS